MVNRARTRKALPDMHRSFTIAAALAAALLVGTNSHALAQQTLAGAYADLKAAGFVTVVRFTDMTYASHRTQVSIFGADGDEDLDMLRRRVTDSTVARVALRTAGFSAGDVVAMASYGGQVYVYVDDLPPP